MTKTMSILRLLLLFHSVLLASISVAKACDASHEDFVPHLPGLNQPLPSNWYSGYLDYELEGRQVHTHYVLVQAEDDFDRTKPLIYWTNGGPGASSLFGLLTELGPLLFSDLSLITDDYKSTGIPTPIYNPYSWTRLGHVLVFDQPAPVGFSYCNNETDSHSCGGLAWTDELASKSTYLALQAFYKKFPCQYAKKDLYLTGESYGGIYVPTLARRIVEDKESKIPLKGFAVGDGCLGTETSICGDLGNKDFVPFWGVLFMAGHGQIPLSTFREFMRACRPQEEKPVLRTSKLCKEVLKKAEKQLGGFYGYSLYDDCTYRNGMLQGGLNDYPCGGDIVMEQWLGVPEVQKALHVKSSYFSVDNAENFDYTPTEKDLTRFYKSVNGKLKVLVYNGDTDPSITSFAAQNWTSHLSLAEKEEWRPWTVDGCRRMGGYVTRYEGQFDFVTIRGAGHMVPAYKAPATFTFLKSWIEGTDYPSYDKDCESPNEVVEHSQVVLSPA